MLPYKLVYAHDRRKHRHKCRRCQKVVNAGELVYMAKVSGSATWVLHDGCALLPTVDGPTSLAYLTYNTMVYQARCGSDKARLWLESNPLK